MPPRTARTNDSAPAAPVAPLPPGAPPRSPLDHPEARMHPPASVTFLEEWYAEYLRNPNRATNFDAARIRTSKDAIESHLHPAAVSPNAPDKLPGIRFAVGQSFDDLEAASARSGLAVHGSTRYTAEAWALTQKGAELLARIRDRSGDRLKEPMFADVRARMQKGADVNLKRPLEVLDGLAAQLACCTNPDDARLLSLAGLYPEVWAAELSPLVTALRKAVHKGKGGATTRGEVSEEVAAALLRLDIALSRAAAFLESFVSPQAAQAFEAEIPRKHAKKAKKDEETGDAEAETGDGEAEPAEEEDSGEEADPAEESDPAEKSDPAKASEAKPEPTAKAESPKPAGAPPAPAPAAAQGGETK